MKYLSDAKTFGRGKSQMAALYAPIRAAINSGLSAVINIISDSLNNEVTEPFYRLLSEKIGAELPSACIIHQLWNDANQAYDPWATIQAGGAGRRHLVFDGANGGTIAHILPASLKAATSADIEVEFMIAMTDWTPASAARIGGQSGSAGNRGWYLQVSTGGQPQFIWSADGTNLITESGTALGFTDGADGRIRVKLDVDNGGGGYTINIDASSDGGTTWVSKLSKTTSAGTTSIFATTANVDFGAVSGSNPWAGKGYEFVIRDGIGGPNRLPMSVEAFFADDTVVTTYGGSPTIYAVNGSAPGQGLAYFGDATRLPKMMPWSPIQLTFINTRHNDSQYGRALGGWVTYWAALVADLRARAPHAALIAINGNPRLLPAGKASSDTQAQMARSMPLMLSRYGVPVVDTYSGFDAAVVSGTPLSALVDADGVHPSKPAGVDIEIAEIWRAIR